MNGVPTEGRAPSNEAFIPPAKPRHTVMIADGADAGDALARLASRFGGQQEPAAGPAVVWWRRSSSVEPAVRLAVALHAGAPGERRIGILAIGSDQDEPEGLTLARALVRLASSGQTLLCADPASVPSSVQCEAFGSLHPDPFDDPVAVVRVVAVASSGHPRARSVGRDAELAEFRHWATAIVDRGRGAVVHIVGDAGIGKSHLLAELRTIAADHGYACHRAFHDARGASRERSALAMLTRSLLGTSGLAVVEGQSSTGSHADPVIEDAWLPFLRDLLGGTMPVGDRRLFEAMAPAVRERGQAQTLGALARARAEAGPVFVEVEDMHWAPPDAGPSLRALARQVVEHPLLLVMTSRPEADPVDDRWLAAAGHPALVRFALDRLHPDAMRTLAASLLSRRRSPWMLSSEHYVRDDVVARCVERSDGHPLLLEQLLLDARPSEDPGAPASVPTLVKVRLAALAPEQQRALGFAAALGERFEIAQVVAAMGGAPWEPEPAVEAGLVTREGPGYRFAHALVQDAIYGTLAEPERRRVHRTLAGVLESAALRADHLERAEDPGAAWACLEAARLEDAAARTDVALRYVKRGLQRANDDTTHFELHALAGRMHVDRGRAEDATNAFEAALGHVATPAERGRALVGQVSALRLMSRLGEAEPLLEEAETIAAANGLSELLGLVAYYRGCASFARGEVDACLAQHELAAHHARMAGQPRTEALALSGLGDAYYAQSRIGTALGVIDRCVELSRTHGFGRIEVANRFMVGALRALENDLRAGLEDCLAAAEMAAQVGNRRAEMLALLNVGMCLTPQGQLEAALAHIERARAIATEMEAEVFHAMIRAFEARAHTLGGDHERAQACALESLGVARGGSMRFFGGVALGVLARCATTEAARSQALAEGEALLAERCVSHNYFYFFEDAIEASLVDERWARAEGYADTLDEVTQREPIARCRLVAARGRALVRLGLAPADAEGLAAARAVRDEAAVVGLGVLLPRLDEALGGSNPGGGA